jgi:hypothetical protein
MDLQQGSNCAPDVPEMPFWTSSGSPGVLQMFLKCPSGPSQFFGILSLSKKRRVIWNNT